MDDCDHPYHSWVMASPKDGNDGHHHPFIKRFPESSQSLNLETFFPCYEAWEEARTVQEIGKIRGLIMSTELDVYFYHSRCLIVTTPTQPQLNSKVVFDMKMTLDHHHHPPPPPPTHHHPNRLNVSNISAVTVLILTKLYR